VLTRKKDGRFGVFPPESGTYNIVGKMGDADKAIAQNISFQHGDRLNIGTIATSKVALLTVQVKTPTNVAPEGVSVEVLGYNAKTTTAQEGVGAFSVGIPTGTYSIRFTKAGLQERVMENVVLVSGDLNILEDVQLLAD